MNFFSVVNKYLYFVIVIATSFPYCLSSTDYEDYLNMNLEPPFGSQYWVAPYISEFIKKYNNIIDDQLVNFLKRKSCLDFSNICSSNSLVES